MEVSLLQEFVLKAKDSLSELSTHELGGGLKVQGPEGAGTL